MSRFWFIKDLSLRKEYKVFDNYKWWDVYTEVKWIIVDKLSYKNSLKSVSLKPILSLLKIKFQKLIDVFCLIICFWVKGSWEFDINVHVKAYLFPEITDKLKVTIWYNGVRNIIFSIKFSEPDVVYTDSIDFLHKHKCGIF